MCGNNRRGVGMTYFDEIMKMHPVRNRALQKEAFRKWALKEAARNGCEGRIEENDGHANIVIGDMDRAKAVFTAHYDTPWESIFPNFMLPRARGLYYLYQMLIIAALLVFGFAAAGLFMLCVKLDYTVVSNRLAPLAVFMVVYYALFFLIFRTFVNRNNANDNTSGVACVLETMKKIPENLRENVLFVLFDDEEKGKKGSKAFFKAHSETLSNLPVINFDCVGFGRHPVFIVKEALEKTEAYAAFEKTYGTLENASIFSAKKARANSDQMSFPMGTGVMTCEKTKRGLLYVGRIHTRRDTVVDQENIRMLSDASAEFVLSMEDQP